MCGNTLFNQLFHLSISFLKHLRFKILTHSSALDVYTVKTIPNMKLSKPKIWKTSLTSQGIGSMIRNKTANPKTRILVLL